MTEPSMTPTPTDRVTTTDCAESAPAPTVLPLVRLLPPPPEGTILIPPEPVEPPRRSWFLLQLVTECRLAVQMYFDPRYRLSRLGQIAFPLFFILLGLNYFVFSVWFSMAIVSPVAERLLDMLLAIVAYRILQRELDRYRAVLDYLAHYNNRR
ncbi:MAG: hypothetical protein RMJ56_10210 [Gemmataceae bacterium]|nr:hypothetical protein [Gemmata sp.]MDW8197963.1 hypothetical protein [Gemmataceae bacterium]